MKVYTIHRKQVLPVSRTKAWSFFADPANLDRLTPDWLQFQIDTPLDRPMYPGMIITYRIKAIAGLPMRWITEITHLRKEEFFVDEQRLGPYRFWHHQHHLRDTGQGVEVVDLVHYALPFSIVGRAAHRMLISNRLKHIFDYRQEKLEEMYGASESQ